MNTQHPLPAAPASLPRDRLDQQLDAVIERAEPRLDAHEQERRHRHREPDIADGSKKFLHVSHLLGRKHAGIGRGNNRGGALSSPLIMQTGICPAGCAVLLQAPAEATWKSSPSL